MRRMGQEDSIYRNYDLSDLGNLKPGQALDKAFARMGFDQAHTLRIFVVGTVAQRMRNVQFEPPPDDQLADLMREWYNWDRIRTGEVRKWKLRSTINLLI